MSKKCGMKRSALQRLSVNMNAIITNTELKRKNPTGNVKHVTPKKLKLKPDPICQFTQFNVENIQSNNNFIDISSTSGSSSGISESTLNKKQRLPSKMWTPPIKQSNSQDTSKLDSLLNNNMFSIYNEKLTNKTGLNINNEKKSSKKIEIAKEECKDLTECYVIIEKDENTILLKTLPEVHAVSEDHDTFKKEENNPNLITTVVDCIEEISSDEDENSCSGSEGDLTQTCKSIKSTISQELHSSSKKGDNPSPSINFSQSAECKSNNYNTLIANEITVNEVESINVPISQGSKISAATTTQLNLKEEIIFQSVDDEAQPLKTNNIAAAQKLPPITEDGRNDFQDIVCTKNIPQSKELLDIHCAESNEETEHLLSENVGSKILTHDIRKNLIKSSEKQEVSEYEHKLQETALFVTTKTVINECLIHTNALLLSDNEDPLNTDNVSKSGLKTDDFQDELHVIKNNDKNVMYNKESDKEAFMVSEDENNNSLSDKNDIEILMACSSQRTLSDSQKLKDNYEDSSSCGKIETNNELLLTCTPQQFVVENEIISENNSENYTQSLEQIDIHESQETISKYFKNTHNNNFDKNLTPINYPEIEFDEIQKQQSQHMDVEQDPITDNDSEVLSVASLEIISEKIYFQSATENMIKESEMKEECKHHTETVIVSNNSFHSLNNEIHLCPLSKSNKEPELTYQKNVSSVSLVDDNVIDTEVKELIDLTIENFDQNEEKEVKKKEHYGDLIESNDDLYYIPMSQLMKIENEYSENKTTNTNSENSASCYKEKEKADNLLLTSSSTNANKIQTIQPPKLEWIYKQKEKEKLRSIITEINELNSVLLQIRKKMWPNRLNSS